MVKLIIEDDEGKTTVVPLIRDEITIGRKEGNTIRLTERNVSRRHARLVKQNGGAIFIEDLNSYNGIRVNGNRIAGRVAVAEGDRIQIGDYVLGLKLEGVPEVVSLQPPQSEARTVELPRPEAIRAAAAPAPAPEPPPPPEPEPEPEPPQPAAETAGRLVCVSTNFPGQEWMLEKSLMVIGRTDDNDVVVNHRSISRHHARIVEEHGRYTIIDLQSSNGVRVNGEEYGKVELRRGDLIDLGHVRLRFVAPGEDFVFSRDASVVDISKPGGGHGLLWIAVTLAVLLVAGGLVWKFVLPTGSGTAATTDAGTPGVEPSAGSGSGSGAAASEDQSELLAELSNAVATEQWAAAVAHCDKLNAANRASQASQCEAVRVEKTAKEAFDEAYAAAVASRDLEAVRLWSKIPDVSAYKQRDRNVFERAREKALTRARSDLGEALQSRTCEKAKALARDIKELDPSDTEAQEKADSCSGAVAEINPETKTKVRVKVRPKVPPKKPEIKITVPTVNQADVDKLLKEAQAAYGSGNHARTAQLAKQVLRMQPGNVMAIQILGASACYLKNEREAKSAFDRLPPASRNLLRQVCKQVGITLQ